MLAEMYWIDLPGPGRLAIMPRPRSDEWLTDELRSLKDHGATLIVSLLEEEEADDLGLRDEARVCDEIGLGFRTFPIRDHGVPPLEQATFAFIEDLARAVAEGKGVAVHCMAGIGRSGLICASVLIALGFMPTDAIRAVSDARGFAAPETDEQCLWLRDYAQRHREDSA